MINPYLLPTRSCNKYKAKYEHKIHCEIKKKTKIIVQLADIYIFSSSMKQGTRLR